MEDPVKGDRERGEISRDGREKEGTHDPAMKEHRPLKKKPLRKEHAAIVSPSGE